LESASDAGDGDGELLRRITCKLVGDELLPGKENLEVMERSGDKTVV
jgi:hypothetical protein